MQLRVSVVCASRVVSRRTPIWLVTLLVFDASGIRNHMARALTGVGYSLCVDRSGKLLRDIPNDDEFSPDARHKPGSSRAVSPS